MKSFHSHRSGINAAAEPKILIGIIADEETTVGFLLAGLGEEDYDKKFIKNFFMVTEATSQHDLERDFFELYNRKNIGVILVGSDIYPKLTNALSRTTKLLPIVVAVPTKSAVVQYLQNHDFDDVFM